jgi:uncharacterized membrane protein (Fun14 family)
VVSELLAKGISSFVIGYLLGKGVKILLYILGFFLLILMGLEAIGYIHIDWEKLASDISTFFSNILNPSQGAGQLLLGWLEDNWPLIIGFLAGFGIGGGIARKPNG